MNFWLVFIYLLLQHSTQNPSNQVESYPYSSPPFSPALQVTTRAQRQAITSYVNQVFGPCATLAYLYLEQTNPSYDTAQEIPHYLPHLESVAINEYVGLFSLDTSVPEVQAYSIEQLKDYQINTKLAYALFQKNNNTFTIKQGTCYNQKK